MSPRSCCNTRRKSELIRELKKGYDYVGLCFVMAVMHKMKETVALIRQLRAPEQNRPRRLWHRVER